MTKKFGRLLQELNNLGQSDRTVVIITADHGESLLEHGVYFDHHSLYEPVARVPLLFLLPDKLSPRHKRVAANVSHVDLFPTILELARIPFSYRGLSGKSLLPVINGHGPISDRPILVEESHFERKRAVRFGRYKMIEAVDERLIECSFCGRVHGDRREIFDIVADPNEMNNFASQRPDLIRKLEALGANDLVGRSSLL